MNEEDIQKKIEYELSKRAKQIINKNAIDALFSNFPAPIKALRKVLSGRKEALEGEKQKITIETILRLLTKIDNAISNNDGKTDGIDWKVIGGDIEAYGENAREVTGMDISSDAGPIELKPGTHIKASGKNIDKITGLKIGGNPSNGDDS